MAHSTGIRHMENESIDLIDTEYSESQKNELRQVRTYTTRLLWNTSIMLRQRKDVDYDYIANQSRKLKTIVAEYDENQVKRIQEGISGTRLSILYYGLLENAVKIAEQTQDLLDIFRESFKAE